MPGTWRVAKLALLAGGALFLAGAVTGTMVGPVTISTTTAFDGPSQERDSIVAQEARLAGMPVALAIAVSHVENWAGDSTARHPISGALGIMQILPKTWSDSFQTECGTDSLVVRRRNACVGVHVALAYFQESGNWNDALRMYAGAWCNKTDTYAHCAKKIKAGDAYVLAVMQRLYRTDLSPARDQMALGTSWRRDSVVTK